MSRRKAEKSIISEAAFKAALIEVLMSLREAILEAAKKESVEVRLGMKTAARMVWDPDKK